MIWWWVLGAVYLLVGWRVAVIQTRHRPYDMRMIRTPIYVAACLVLVVAWPVVFAVLSVWLLWEMLYDG